MDHRAVLLATVTMALLLAGCAQEGASPEGAAQESGGNRGAQERARDGAEHVAEGTINSIDAARGTVNISHEPVESIGWPAMRMNFQLADPDLAAQVTPGQRIEFRFRTDRASATVTEITPVEESD